MSWPTVNGGLPGSVYGVQTNGDDSDDSAMSESVLHAGGIFRSSTPEDQQRCPVGARVPGAVTHVANYMNPPLGESGTDKPSVVKFIIGSDDESSDDDGSSLSSGSSEPGNLTGLEQSLQSLLVEGAYFPEGAGVQRGLITVEAIKSSLNELASLSSSQQGGKDMANAREKLGQMITNAITTDDLAELPDIAGKIQAWLKTNGTLLNKYGVKPVDPKIPDFSTGAMVQIKFEDYINGIANTGVMSEPSKGVEKINTYLQNHGISIHGYSLCTDMRNMPMVSLSFYRQNAMCPADGEDFPDFTYLLDGDKNKDWHHLARELDAYFQPIFASEGGSVPAGTFEEYFRKEEAPSQ
ncbi:hypothetical protein [Endozoicomonas sp. ONNA2]|uniref:hypothetical protein n=1 Tax=Endozoicomonas sp. ONNA2 TaxID=2828741 RepID=UPI002147340D|nr:hypothetical protein [Endozoicomonas sp. ONNA2]